MANSKTKKLKKSESLVGWINHLTYNRWNSEYELVKKILTVHQEIKNETHENIIPSWMSKDEAWKYRYELLEGELELMYKELEDFAKKKYQLQIDTSIFALKEKKKFWSITLMEQSNLQPAKSEDEPPEIPQHILQ